METWIRDDGRFYCMDLFRDLYGPAVIVWYGGQRSSRTRIIPVDSTVAGEKILDALARRRQSHGYRRTNG
jgi:hypothetical protein